MFRRVMALVVPAALALSALPLVWIVCSLGTEAIAHGSPADSAELSALGVSIFSVTNAGGTSVNEAGPGFAIVAFAVAVMLVSAWSLSRPAPRTGHVEAVASS